MPPPGGDVIGRRRLDPHLDAFSALGARVERGARHRDRAPAAACAPATSSWTSRRVMGTENALMAAALTPGTTVDPQRGVRAARAGPRAHARAMGAAIEGIGSNV